MKHLSGGNSLMLLLCLSSCACCACDACHTHRVCVCSEHEAWVMQAGRWVGLPRDQAPPHEILRDPETSRAHRALPTRALGKGGVCVSGEGVQRVGAMRRPWPFDPIACRFMKVARHSPCARTHLHH